MSDSNVPPVPPVPQVPPVPGQPGQPGQQPPTQAYPQQPNPTAPTAPYGQPPQFGGQPPQFGGPQGPQGPGFGGPQGPGGPGFGGPQGPGAPYGQPPQGGGDSKKLLWIILAGVGVLLIAAAIVWAFVAGPFSGGGDNKSDKETTAPSTEPKPGKSDKPKEDKGSDDSAVGVVKSYLNALADGDATKAIGYLESKPSGDLVTEEMLKASIEIAPITDIEVEDSDYRVTATFKVGDEEVSMDLSTKQSGKKYKISKYSVGSVYLFGTAPTSGLEVNGIAFSAPSGSGSIDAFPILYRFSSTSKYIQLSGTTDVIAYDMSTMVDVDASVTEEGQNVARDAVKASVAACLAEKTLASSCGMDVTSPLSGGETVAEGSVTRVLPSSEQSQLDNLTLDPDYSNPLLLSTYKSFRPDITATCTNTSGATGTCSIIKFGGSKSPVVDLSKDPVTVTWE